jgi:SSS family solute:Na+ symporter
MDNFHLSSLDIIIIVAITLFVVIIGLVAAKKSERTVKGYFLASGKMPWYLVGAAFVATTVSSEQMVGTMGATYKDGMGIANWTWWALPTYLLTMIFFIPMYLRNNIMTVPEFLKRRFGPGSAMIYSVVMIFGYVLVFLPPILYGGSITVSELTGWNQYYVMAGIVIVTASYTLVGGLNSVMWTDAIQCILLMGGGVLFFWLALDHIPGGWDAMVAAAPKRFHLYHPPSDPEAPFLGLIVASFGVFLFYQSSNQVMIQRILSAKSTWDGMMGLVFAGFIGIALPIVTCLTGLIMYHWLDVMHSGPSLLPDKYDKAFPLALEAFAPSGLKGVILAGFFAAIMSSVSALSNSISTIFSLDIYRNFFRKNAGDREMIISGQISGGLALLIASLVAPLVGTIGLFKYFQIGVTYIATPFISAILLGIFWKRTNDKGAVVGLIGGVAIQLIIAAVVSLLEIKLHWLYTGGIAQILTMLLIIVVSLNTAPLADSQVKPFIWRPSWVLVLDDGIKRPWWKQVKLWMLLYALAWCFIYWRFW